MTREEAIKILKGAIKKPNTKDGYLGQALDMAIKALEQLPSEDCISREALIHNLQAHRNFFAISYGTYKNMSTEEKVRVDEIDNCIVRVVNAPSVTPQPKVGEWIFVHPLQEDDEGAYMCSCCGVGNWGIDPKVDKYCFNCGAKMEVEE